MSKQAISRTIDRSTLTRRLLLGGGLGLALTLMAAAAGMLAFPGAARAQEAAQRLADHFSSVKTMRRLLRSG